MSRLVTLVIFDDFQLLDAAGPLAAFEMACRRVPGAYDLRVVSLHGGNIRSSVGVPLGSEPFPTPAAPDALPDTLVVAGGRGVFDAAACAPTVAYVRTAATSARRTASVCSGAYVLAAAGLLSGRRATTHWQNSADFQQRHPDVRLDADRIYVRDGAVWTSAGISAGIDLALALIADDLGEDVARWAARQLVVYFRRPGGQFQISALLDLGGDRFAALLDHVRNNLASPLRVEDLAAEAGMSPRHFARVFTAEVGTTPARAVERLRVEAAAAALESGAPSLQGVARQCGFGDAERMRRAFLRLRGAAPSVLKAAADGVA